MGTKARSWAHGLIAVCLLSISCRTTSDDVERWANTQQGPRKLVAVLTHGKYPRSLRVDAAMTLIGMRPRGGQRVGIDKAIEAVSSLETQERDKLLAAMLPGLIEKLTAAPPEGAANDESLPYKDTAFELLTAEPPLIAQPEQREVLENALTQWAMADFVRRMGLSGQRVGMEQMLKRLGAKSVAGLPALITKTEPKVDRIAHLVATIGDDAAKLLASARLVDRAKYTASNQWLDAKRPELEEANEASGQKPDAKAFTQQLTRYQEEELLRLFGSMRRVGGKPAVDYLLQFAAAEARPETQRKGALAALERKVDAGNQAQLDAIVGIASASETPDAVRGLALRRVGELPREKVVEPLLNLFDHDNWKVRWLAAELLLKMSETKHVEQFMDRLSKVKHMSLTEPLRYGQLIGEMKGEPSPEELADSYSSSSKKMPARLTALGYYYSHGSADDKKRLERLKRERKKLPSCAEEAKDCEWRCAEREVETLGEYVEHCILPALDARTSGPTSKGNSKPSQDPQKTQ